MADTSRQRRIKYGANVALSSLLVIALAVMVVYIVQQRPRRIDTTAAALYSLKPQTLSVIANNSSPIRLVSLYRSKDTAGPAAEGERERAQIVQDLLTEYAHKGKNITVEFIDPQSQPAKEDALIRDVSGKYSGEVETYRAFLDAYEKDHAAILNACTTEAEILDKLTGAAPGETASASGAPPEIQETFTAISDTLRRLPRLLEQLKNQVDRERRRKLPDYPACVEIVKSGVSGLQQRVGAIVQLLIRTKDAPNLPDAFKAYISESLPRYESMHAACTKTIEAADKLGELKIDTLRQSLQQRDPIVVIGQNDIRVVPFEQVWREEIDRRTAGGNTQVKLKPRFAGEQMITAAIMGVNDPQKRTVAFIRAGGEPLTEPGFPPIVPGGPMSEIGQRLRDYNFEVVERDLSGQWEMQAQMRGMPAAPEASDEQLKNAIWVVLAFGGVQRGAPDPIPVALQKHLSSGGTALVMLGPTSAGYELPLTQFGILPASGAIAMHDAVKAGETANPDPLADARREQPVFDVRDYGSHLIAGPLRSLESWLFPITPIKIADKAPGDVKVSPLMPLVAPGLNVWGETDLQGLQENQQAKFDTGSDVPAPIYAGAAAEKEKAGRLVVIGAPRFAFDAELTEPDPDLAKQGVRVARFPANAELFMNSVFWLAKMDQMVALSPSAMEVSRIRPMSQATLNGWRVGLLLIGIPGAVVAAGLIVFFNRRD